jgi:hypothetical protein
MFFCCPAAMYRGTPSVGSTLLRLPLLEFVGDDPSNSVMHRHATLLLLVIMINSPLNSFFRYDHWINLKQTSRFQRAVVLRDDKQHEGDCYKFCWICGRKCKETVEEALREEINNSINGHWIEVPQMLVQLADEKTINQQTFPDKQAGWIWPSKE